MKWKKILCFIFVCITLFSISLPVFAADLPENHPFDKTTVIEDLVAMGYDLNEYPRDSSAYEETTVIDFVEFGYYYYNESNLDYALYVYVYNPTGDAILEEDNYIQLSYKDEEAASFEKYKLSLISVSEDLPDENGEIHTDYEGLFYKFRLDPIKTFILQRSLSRDVRTYWISGIELNHETYGIKDFPVSHKWVYTGYMTNHGPIGKHIPLYYTVEKFDTIEIEIHSTSWFTPDSGLGEDYRWELSSVYFAIPDWVIKKYGNPDDEANTSGLIAVRGSYNKWLVNGLLIPDKDVYNQFMENDYLYNLNISDDYSDYTTGDSCFYKILKTNQGGAQGNILTIDYELSFNHFLGEKRYPGEKWTYSSNNIISQLYYPMYAPNYSVSSDYFLKKYEEKDWKFYNYDNSLVNGWNVFGDTAYFDYEVSVDQGPWNDVMSTFEDTHPDTWLNRLKYGKAHFSDEIEYGQIDRLVELGGGHFLGDEEDISKKLFVLEEDAPALKDFYDEYKSDNHVYLMRFDANPYYAPKVTVLSGDGKISCDGVYFEKVVYEDFDILEMDFRDKKGGKKTLGVVCTPITILGPVPGPGDINADYNPNKPGIQTKDDETIFDMSVVYTIIALVLVVCIILVILNFLGVPIKPIIKAIFFVLTLPFKILGWIVKAIGKLFGATKSVSEEKRKRNEEKRTQEKHDWARKEEEEKERKRQKAHDDEVVNSMREIDNKNSGEDGYDFWNP